jgi:outer membrane lipoprotein SlyB
VGGGLALVALGSLATALVLRGPGAAPGADAATAAGPAVARAEEPRETIVSSKSPAPRPAATAPAAPAATPTTTARCADCGVVQGVTAIERKGEATGLGAVGGAVAGGLLGSQMGGGSGKDAMTVIGAVGGGVAGHHMERKLRSSTEYRVRVKMADGTTRTLSHPTRLAVGDAVRVDGERLLVASRSATPAAASTAGGTRTAQAEPREQRPAAASEERPRSLADAKRL